ncbi:MAG: nucleotidyltransferase domain-containing protein [Leptospiraceae bacterium]|nr:nucleotidyltransferase domain-containing protein [Leptospiraceae bacterium]
MISAENLNQLKTVCQAKHVQKAILFGSHAKNDESKKSDFDLVLIYETAKRFFDRYEDFSDLYPIFNDRLDLLLYTPSEWVMMSNRKFIQSINQTGVVLYEQ